MQQSISLVINKALQFSLSTVWGSEGLAELLSPVPPSHLGPGEDGSKEVDEPELELIGELPTRLETLCKYKRGSRK